VDHLVLKTNGLTPICTDDTDFKDYSEHENAQAMSLRIGEADVV
jgi:hypothetical protein